MSVVLAILMFITFTPQENGCYLQNQETNSKQDLGFA
jgi:hypothetical protein